MEEYKPATGNGNRHQQLAPATGTNRHRPPTGTGGHRHRPPPPASGTQHLARHPATAATAAPGIRHPASGTGTRHPASGTGTRPPAPATGNRQLQKKYILVAFEMFDLLIFPCCLELWRPYRTVHSDACRK